MGPPDDGGSALSQAVKGWVPDSDRRVIAASEEAGDVLSDIRNVEFLATGQRRILKALVAETLPPALGILAVCALLASVWSL